MRRLMLQALAHTHTHTHTHTDTQTHRRTHTETHTHTHTVQTMFYDPKPIGRTTYFKTMVYYETDKLAVNNGTNKCHWSVGVT